ncbi:hypothetical protein [Ktedonobacter robiniae]|uniref:Zinc-ribbon domain-containing protein n=1 Tax=Ktedonobacter robiniae TaxID=2778365 RepID=A0ABQ3UK59_9CHLR|nr:hypothetical protein [Ktedonobacter robiniae]GHO53114.1 hypothetical protein KSB_15890 [Ktedonobacter robiniae]
MSNPMFICPQCGESNEESAKNCRACRINLYWAAQHYAELAHIKQSQQQPSHPPTASFLLQSSQRADQGPVATWLARTIQRFGLQNAVPPKSPPD